MNNRYDLIIIGSGPAGMTAAIYAKRTGLKTLVIEASAPGGKLIKTYNIENYPSIKTMAGADLAMAMFEHMQSFEVETVFDDVIDLKCEGETKEVVTNGESYFAKAIIVATGTKERLLNIPGEKEFTGRGVSYCAVCDGMFFKNKDVAVIGGGNSALEEALYLSEFVNKLYIIIRRDVFRTDAIIADKIKNNSKIEIITKHIPVEIKGVDKVDTLMIEDVDTRKRSEIKVSGVFPYIGADPCTYFLSKLGILDEYGYVLVNERMETSVEGIFGAGDCIKKELRQVITACSDGAIAGQNAYHYVRKQ